MSREEEEEEESGPFEYSSLCYLIHHSLTPYTVNHRHKQNHKNLLIALSQVFTQIKLWTLEFHCHSDNERVANPAAKRECSIGSEHHCLTKIVGDLIFFLGMESQYVQHLVENVLVAVSEMVASSGSCWDKFIDSLCLYLELAINPLSPPLDPQTRAKHFECDSSRVIALKQTLKNVNWSLAVGIIRVLRNILKHIKQEFDDQLFKVYLNSVGSCLSNVPWDWLNEIPVDPNGGSLSNSNTDPLLVTDIGQRNSRVMFWGSLVQFFCSLVAQSGSVEATACLDKHPVVREINIIFPKVLAWCLGEQSDCSKMSMSQYFRHKNLMLMVNLSYHIHMDCSTLVSWLHLIHIYFQDLLSEPIYQMEFGQNDCLEGSPFWASFPDVEKESMSRRHLQRLTVFLFLRCCFSLINLRERLDEHCICEPQDSCLIYEQYWGPMCCSRKKGLLEIYQWLQSHFPTDIFVNHQMYSETCTCFTLSFLQLYMHEVVSFILETQL